jgi:hypothetical protein
MEALGALQQFLSDQPTRAEFEAFEPIVGQVHRALEQKQVRLNLTLFNLRGFALKDKPLARISDVLWAIEQLPVLKGENGSPTHELYLVHQRYWTSASFESVPLDPAISKEKKLEELRAIWGKWEQRAETR